MKFFIGVSLAIVSATLAFSTDFAGAQTAPANSPKLETVQTGELRLDGKIILISGRREWQIEANSFTSPSGKTVEFPESREKTISLSDATYLHPRGEEGKVAPEEVKVGSRIAVIGKNGPNGVLLAREIILLEGYGSRQTIGSISTNPVTSRLVDQSREARELGQLPRALGLIQQAISAAQGARDLTGEGLATQDMALLYLDSEQPQKAFEAFERVTGLGQASNNALLQTMGLSGAGRILAAARKWDEALGRLEQARDISASLEPNSRTGALGTLFYLYLQQNRIADAQSTLSTLYPLEEAAGARVSALDSLLQLAILQSATDERAAKSTLELVPPRLESVRDEAARPILLRDYGAALFLVGDAPAAQERWNEAKTLFDAARNERDAASLVGLKERLQAAGADPRARLIALSVAPGAAGNPTPPNPENDGAQEE